MKKVEFLKEYKIMIVLNILSKDNTFRKFVTGPHLSLDIDYALKRMSKYEYISKKNGGPKKGKRSYYFYIKGYTLIPKMTN